LRQENLEKPGPDIHCEAGGRRQEWADGADVTYAFVSDEVGLCRSESEDNHWSCRDVTPIGVVIGKRTIHEHVLVGGEHGLTAPDDGMIIDDQNLQAFGSRGSNYFSDVERAGLHPEYFRQIGHRFLS
jgi:hypothetical protein